MQIGVLHPGEMGISVAMALKQAGHEPCWVRSGRSAATQARAGELKAYDELAPLLTGSDAVVSVCPPHAALAQAQAVKALDFAGIYVDANAVAPSTAAEIAALIGDAYVDGGIVGPPAHKPGTTRLYLSGAHAAAVADWFAGSALEAIAIDDSTTSASALKMAYAAYTKGSSALLLAVNALAVANGVRDVLCQEWARSQPGLEARSEGTAKGTSRKAWRFVGEMEEIAQTFASAGLPGDFHLGAAEVYRRMSALKDSPPSELADVLAQILDADR